MRVLAFSHTALVSGAERSLLELLAGLGEAEPGVELALAAPAGPLSDRARAAGIPIHAVTGTSGSFKLHPLRTPLALIEVARSAWDLRRAARRFDAELVHANSVRAGLVALAARALGGPPVVLHVRDVLPPTRLARALAGVAGRGARTVIAISSHVARAFGAGDAVVVTNPVDLDRFAPGSADGARVRDELGLRAGDALLVVIGQITPWKGQEDAIATLAAVRERHPGARLVIVGEPKFVAVATRYDNRAYEHRLRGLAAALGDGAVVFTGEREDVPALLAAADLVLVPSWDEPFGRTVVEAMAMGRCVLATAVGGPAEILTDGVDGRLLAPRDPAGWAAAASALLDDPDERERLGSAAHARAQAFDRRTHARRIAELYRSALRA